MQTRHENIWSCIEQVSHFQERSSLYLGLYQKFIIKSQEQNEFLTEDVQHHFSCEQNSKYWQRDVESREQKRQVIIDRMDVGNVNEESIEFVPKMIDLSRIFKDISLGDDSKPKQSNNIGIELHFESNKSLINLTKYDNSYSLSNFSSFNNNKTNETYQSFEIKDLLIKIQQKIGRQLNKKGIQSIINQLQMTVALELQPKHKMRESEITQHSLKVSHIDNQTASFNAHNVFDFQLQTNALKQNTKYMNTIQQHHHQLFQHRDNIGHLTNNVPTSQCLNKQNKQLVYKKKKTPLTTKEIRIIRKNNPKNSLVMTYTDIKQLENFCISNKIYGKDKEKIAKAIRQNKNIVSLD